MGNSVLPRLRALAPVMSTLSMPRGRHRLHVMPTSCGYEIRHDERYDWNGLKRGQTPFTVLQHTIAGTGHLTYERRRYRLGPGDTMLVIVPHNHRYWLEPGESWEYLWLSTTGRDAVAVQRDIQAAAGPVFRLGEAAVETLARCCLSFIEGEGRTPGAASATAYEALMALYDDILFRGHAAPSPGDDRIARTVRHIRANLAESLDVTSLAEMAGLSRTQFTRAFAGREGIPPAEFIMHERMSQAARLLGQPAIRVGDAARSCGFADANYFAKAFRRTFGISPTEFRTTGMYAAAGRRDE